MNYFDQGLVLTIIVIVAIVSGLDYVDTRGSGYPAWVLDSNRKVRTRTMILAPFLFMGVMRIVLNSVTGSPSFEEILNAAALSGAYVALAFAAGRSIGARQNKQFS